MEQNLKEKIKREPLGKYEILTSKSHSFGTDAVLLSDFSSVNKAVNMCDLGTGCGIIPLLMIKNGKAKAAVGVDIQREACELATESAKINGIEDRFKVLNGDLKELKGKIPLGTFDLVTCNPPYKASGTGIQSHIESERIARHEILCNFFDIAKVASQLLKYSGRFCVCHRPERLADVICEMRVNRIEPKRIREVIQRKGERAWLILVEGRLGGKAGMTVMPPLYVEEDGMVSDELMKIYGDYKEGRGRKI